MKLKNLILTAFFVALALVFNLLEGLLPFPLPGVKLGLANVFALAALVMLGTKEAFFVTILRVILAWLITANIFSFLCGMTGGLLATVVMAVMYTKFQKEFSLPWISVAGAWAFNIGQTIIATYIVGDIRLMYYVRPLLIIGTVTGWVVGKLAEILCTRLNQFK